MNKFSHWLDRLSHRQRQARARQLRQRTRSTRLSMELLEDRRVMDAALSDWRTGYSLNALGTDAKWISNSFSACNGLDGSQTCVTTSPVAVNAAGAIATATDGGTYSQRTFYPANGLLTVNNGQQGNFAQQQEIDLGTGNYFPYDVVPSPGNLGNTVFKTTIKAPATGTYTFYLTAAHQESYLRIGSQGIRSVPGVTSTYSVALTAGTTYPVEAKFSMGGKGRTDFKVEWSGPGLTPRRLTPDSDVSWTHQYGPGVNKPNATGVIPLNLDTANFTLTWNGQTTAPLKVGATAEAVQNALNALRNIGGAGGSVTVTRSPTGTKYVVTFGGNTWFRPSLISIEGRPGARVSPITTFALTKRDPQSKLSLNLSNGDRLTVDIPNGNTFPIDNAPLFTPEKVSYQRSGDQSGVRLRGYLQTPSIGGRFDPVAKRGNVDFYNVTREGSTTGFRVADLTFSNLRTYTLNPLKDAAGNSRPITLFTLGGLNFEAPAGTQADLVFKDPFIQNDLEFQAVGDSMLVSAPYDGGRLTIRLLRDGIAPLYTANLRTGKFTITQKFEFVSFEIGGLVMTPSSGFSMAYDAAAEKFNFTIRNLTVESPHPSGKASPQNPYNFQTLTQNFERQGLAIGGASYEYGLGVKSIAEFERMAAKVMGTGSPSAPFLIPEALNPSDSVIRYKTSLKVMTSGEYTFTPDQGVDPNYGPLAMYTRQATLKINGQVVSNGGENASGRISLTAGVEYPLELTVVSPPSSYPIQAFNIVMSGPGLSSPQRLGAEPTLQLGSYLFGNGPATSKLYPVSGPEGLTVDNVRKAVNAVIDDPAQKLSAAERSRIKDRVTIAITGQRVSIGGVPFPIGIQKPTDGSPIWRASYEGAVSSPVKMVIPAGNLSLTKGKLDPITALTIDSFEIGMTTADSSGNYTTSYEPIKPTSAGGFKVAFFPLNTYSKDGAVDVPGNSFGIYGNQTRLPLNTAGVTLNGLANLGTATSPGLIVTNGQFSRLSYAIPDVSVENLTFTAASVGSAKPLTVNYFPPQGTNRKSYVVLGGAVMKPGGTVVKTDLKANFGGLGSDGLRIFPDNQSFTFSFGVAETFLAGTQAIQSAPGVNGLKLVYDPKTRAYNFQGTGYLDFNPKTPHTPTDLAFTGSKLEISASVPNGVTNFPANRLDGNTLNFFFGDQASINGFLLSPRATNQPLRVTITNTGSTTTETVGGAFTMRIDGENLFGVMEASPFTGAKFPAAGFVLDLTAVPGQPSGFILGGISFDGAAKATLTDTLTLKFQGSRLGGEILAQGAAGSEPNILVVKNGKVTRAEITSNTPRQVGDVRYQRFTVKYAPLTTGGIWTFNGPGTYFGQQVDVGAPSAGNPQMKLGGDPKKGYQLQTLNTPANPPNPEFNLPPTIELGGLTFDLTNMPQDEPVVDEGPAGKTFSLKSPSYSVKLGNTSLSLKLGMKVKVSAAGAEVVSFSATGVQNSAFRVANAEFRVQTLRVEYVVGEKTFNISGSATFKFAAGSASVEMSVTLGTKEDPGLVIKNGAIDSLKVTVDGSFELLKLMGKAEGLTLAYKKENEEFAIYGALSISTAEQSGIQIIKNMAVTLGSEDTPGIKIVNGQLDSLDIAIHGEINLFKLTAAPKDLRIRYTSAENQLQITGEVAITLAPKLTLTAGLPGDGLLIDTDSGKVQIRGVSLKAEGDIKFGVMTVKGLHVDYEEGADGDVTIGAGAEIQLPSGLALGGSFKIVNGKLDAISIVFARNPGILVANGLINIYRIEVGVEGLSDLENFKFTGSISATVGPLVKFSGESYALADVKGTVIITPRDLTLEGEVQLVGGNLGQGHFRGVLAWNETPRVTFNAEVRLMPGDVVRGTINAYADIQGNVDFNAQMGVYVPEGIPLAGGESLGNLAVELRVRPALEPSASYVKFGFSDFAINPFRIPTFHGDFRLSFDRMVDYRLGARFYIPLPWPFPDIDYSLDFGGRFQLRDSDQPRIEILAAASLPGTPDGEIVYVAATPLPEDTLIDLYADRDDDGNDGLLIASDLPFRAGTQTFTWDNMAAFANPGEPVYVYAVIRDQRHPQAYSDYSPRFNAAPGFTPTITHPASLSFTAGDVATFVAASGHAIVINDPRSSGEPGSEVEAVLNVGGGTLDLSHAPANVRYSGEGTGTLVLRGTAADLTDALDGLHYVQFAATDKTDSLEITVRNLPLQNLVGGTTVRIELNPNPLAISLIAAQHEDSPTEITAGEPGQTPLMDLQVDTLNGAYLTGATIQINDYEPGKDILNLTVGDEFVTGVEASFDRDTGVMTLSNFDWVGDYVDALRSITFSTTSLTSGKSLTVKLSDDDGGQAEFTVPLEVVAGHVEPVVSLSANGLSYLAGSGPRALAPDAVLDAADDASIEEISIAFTNDSYVPGQDVLRYSGTNFRGDFNADTGVLSLVAQAANLTESDWNVALQEITYEAIGETFTEGPRYLEITVRDSSAENNVGSAFFVIDNSLVADSHESPVLTLGTHDLNLPANEDFIYVNPELTLTASSPYLVGATIAISENYLEGEDELSVTSLWDGMDVQFDSRTGVLTITGVATAFEYEDVLRSVIFIDSAGYRTPGQIELTFAVSDGLSASEIETQVLTIAAAPYLDTELLNVLTYTEGRTSEAVDSGLQIEYEGVLNGATVTISAGYEADQDVLVFENQSGISGVFDTTTGILTLTGNASVDAYEAALESVQYRNSRHNPVAGDRIISFQVLDGTAASNVSESLISVEPIVVPPLVSVGTTTTYTENGSAVSIAPELTLTPVDATTPFLSAPELLYGAEIDIVNYVPGEDRLLFVPTDTISGEFDLTEGRIYLVGEATMDDYEAAIRSIRYVNASDVPTTQPRQISIRLLDSGLNGLQNRALVTEVIVGQPDPVTLVSGTLDDIQVLENDEAESLGLEDLVFDVAGATDQNADVRFTVTELPGELVGRILLADGSPLALNVPYSVDELAGLKFQPTPGGSGSGELSFSVALYNPDTALLDTARLDHSLTISVTGVAVANESEAYVAQAYRDLLGRNPDVATLTSLAGQLEQLLERVGRATQGFDSPETARRSLWLTFMNGDSYRQEQINGFYQAWLGRAATSDELAATDSLDELRVAVLGSQEYIARHEESGYESYVDALYGDVMGRTPTGPERDSAVHRLMNGDAPESVAADVVAASNSDQSSLESLLRDLLHRDTEFGDDFRFDFSSRDGLRLSIISSDEYHSLFAVVTEADRAVTRETSDFPSVGMLGDLAGDKAGGTLIAPQYVLVAAHSVAGIPPRQLTFTLGGTRHHVLDVFLHPDFDLDFVGLEGSNDLAILQLETPVNDVPPSPLTGRSPRLGDVLSLVGFGEHEGSPYGTKRVGWTPPVDEVGDTIFRWTHESELQNDSDPGDSGSPLMVTINGVDHVIGIVSGGTNGLGGLGDVATNMRIDRYLDWIRSVVPTITASDTADPPSLFLETTELTIDENSGQHTIGLEVSGTGGSTVLVETDNPDMFTYLLADLGASNIGELIFETGVNQRGTAHIMITVFEGDLSTSETVTITVEERNDPPTMRPLPRQVLNVSPGLQTIPLDGVTAGVGESGNVRIAIADVVPVRFFSTVSVNQPVAGDSTGEDAPNPPTLSFMPAPGVEGRGTIVLELLDAGPDGQFNSSDDLSTLEVVEILTTTNLAPTLNPLGSLRLTLSGDVQTINLSGISDGDDGTQPLQVSVTSSDEQLVVGGCIYDPASSVSTGQLQLLTLALGTARITVTVTDAGTDRVLGTGDDRPFSREFSVEIVESLNGWHNSNDPLDVNGDGSVAPSDVLAIINDLNGTGARLLAPRPAEPPYIDVNDDGAVAPNDALLIINELNSKGSGEGEKGRGLPVVREVTNGTPVSGPNSRPIRFARASNVRHAAVSRAFRQEVNFLDEAARASLQQAEETSSRELEVWEGSCVDAALEDILGENNPR